MAMIAPPLLDILGIPPDQTAGTPTVRWGLTIDDKRCVVGLQRVGDGAWQILTSWPPRLCEHLDVFCAQHAAWLSTAGHPSVANDPYRAARAQRAQAQQDAMRRPEPTPPAPSAAAAEPEPDDDDDDPEEGQDDDRPVFADGSMVTEERLRALRPEQLSQLGVELGIDMDIVRTGDRLVWDVMDAWGVPREEPDNRPESQPTIMPPVAAEKPGKPDIAASAKRSKAPLPTPPFERAQLEAMNWGDFRALAKRHGVKAVGKRKMLTDLINVRPEPAVAGTHGGNI